jgi:hypothetical protein
MPRSLLTSAIAFLVLQTSGVQLPNSADSFKFAVLGDSGTGKRTQYELAAELAAFRARLGYTTVVLTGDSIQGSARPRDFMEKFETPYTPLLERGVTFHAALGDRDTRELRYYKLFNMNGMTYYTFRPAPDVRFFVLDSTRPDGVQMAWLEKELVASADKWKIAAFHDARVRETFEPLLMRHNVSAVFNTQHGPYEAVKPKNGVGYLVAGELSFIAAEINGDEMRFNVISRGGAVVDSGVVTRRK